MHRILFQIILLTIFLSTPISAEDFNVEQFMAQNGLMPYTIGSVVSRCFFDTVHSLHFVGIQSGKLLISDKGGSGVTEQNYYRPQEPISYRVGNIEYIGTNNEGCEWGCSELTGRLVVVVDGQSTELMKGNIVNLLPIGNKLYITEGWAHLGWSEGSIHVIPNKFKPTKPLPIAYFTDAPRFVYFDGTKNDYQAAVIVCTSSIMVLTPNDRIEKFDWDGFLSFIPITSLVGYNNYYFIGLPYGVAVTPSFRDSQKLTFYGGKELQRIIQSCNKQVVEEQSYIDDTKILVWNFDDIKKLAMKGDSKAQVKLGAMYSLYEHRKLAVYWFTKAAEQGDTDAQRFLENLNILMSED